MAHLVLGDVDQAAVDWVWHRGRPWFLEAGIREQEQYEMLGYWIRSAIKL